MKNLTVILLLFCFQMKGQVTDVNNQINTQLFGEYNSVEPKSKPFKKPKNQLSYFNPLYYLSSGGLFIYQNLISEQFQADCKYHISCSEYTKISIERNGLIGLFMGLDQISNCYPKAYYQYAPFLRMDDAVINNVYSYED